MTDQIIIEKLHTMPESLKREVLDFMSFLIEKYGHAPSSGSSKTPVFGSAKGKYILSPDFDEPLDDFKEYM
jgi:hypothetical protein